MASIIDSSGVVSEEAAGQDSNRTWMIVAALLLILLTIAAYQINWWISYAVGFLGGLLFFGRFLKTFFWFLTFVWILLLVNLVVATLAQIFIVTDPGIAAIARRPDGLGRLVDSILGALALQAALGFVVGTLAVVVLMLPLLTVMWLATVPVLALHDYKGITRRDAIRWLFSLIFKIQYPWVIIEDGKEVRGREKGILDAIGGPGIVVVRPGNAVVLEKDGKITQIGGPGVYKTGLYENVHAIVRLNPLWGTEEITNVLTSDGMPLTFTLGVGYQIEPLPDTIARLELELTKKGRREHPELAHIVDSLRARQENAVIDGDYPVWRENIRKATMNVTPAGWEILSVVAAESQLRDTVGSYRFDQILRPVDFDENSNVPTKFEEDRRTIRKMEQYVLETWVPAAAESFGIRIRTVDIQGVDLPDEVRTHLIEWWGGHWGRMARIRRQEPERKVSQLDQKLDLAEASVKARVRLIESEAEMQELINRGKGEAEARARQLKTLLTLLYDLLDREAMIQIIKMMCESMAKSEDRRFLFTALRGLQARSALLPSDMIGGMGGSEQTPVESDVESGGSNHNTD